MAVGPGDGAAVDGAAVVGTGEGTLDGAKFHVPFLFGRGVVMMGRKDESKYVAQYPTRS